MHQRRLQSNWTKNKTFSNFWNNWKKVTQTEVRGWQMHSRRTPQNIGQHIHLHPVPVRMAVISQTPPTAHAWNRHYPQCISAANMQRKTRRRLGYNLENQTTNHLMWKYYPRFHASCMRWCNISCRSAKRSQEMQDSETITTQFNVLYLAS